MGNKKQGMSSLFSDPLVEKRWDIKVKNSWEKRKQKTMNQIYRTT